MLHVEGRGREQSRVLLMDPGQLLYDLDQVIHGGFPLHPTSIINLHREEKALETLAGAKKHSQITQEGVALVLPRDAVASPSLEVF